MASTSVRLQIVLGTDSACRSRGSSMLDRRRTTLAARAVATEPKRPTSACRTVPRRDAGAASRLVSEREQPGRKLIG